MFTIKQPILGVNDESREGFIYSRIASTNNIQQLTQGVGVRNEWSRSPGDPSSLFGLYFSGMGKVMDIPNGDVTPVGDKGATVKPMKEGAVEDLLSKGRYAVVVHLKVDRGNFPRFIGAIGEIEDVSGRKMHRMELRNNYEDLKGYMCQIATHRLTRQDWEGLEDDVQILVIDREHPPSGEISFRAYKDFIRDFEASREVKHESTGDISRS